jgi:glycosyltransferase involved in cell wall biosynthesis
VSLVSIIIPAYNSSEYIKQTLESVLEQTYRPIEVIVVDDGSTDNTIAIASHFKDHGVIILANPKKGACAARNFGYHHSKGEFIQFLDADDPIAPDKIEKQLKQLLSYNNWDMNLIHCSWGRFSTNRSKVYYWGPDKSIQKRLKPIEWLVENKWSITGAWLLHRRLIEKAGLWDVSLKRNQDGEYYTRIMLYANEVLYCEEAIVYYRSGNKNSITNTNTRSAIKSLLKSLQLIEKYMLQLEDSPRVKLSIANRYQDFVYSNFIDNPDLATFAEIKVKELGGANVSLPGSISIRCISYIFGWKNALKLKKMIYN